MLIIRLSNNISYISQYIINIKNKKKMGMNIKSKNKVLYIFIHKAYLKYILKTLTSRASFKLSKLKEFIFKMS